VNIVILTVEAKISDLIQLLVSNAILENSHVTSSHCSEQITQDIPSTLHAKPRGYTYMLLAFVTEDLIILRS
jgi:hypothetical protein